jgi:hypothetical protein
MKALCTLETSAGQTAMLPRRLKPTRAATDETGDPALNV